MGFAIVYELSIWAMGLVWRSRLHMLDKLNSIIRRIARSSWRRLRNHRQAILSEVLSPPNLGRKKKSEGCENINIRFRIARSSVTYKAFYAIIAAIRRSTGYIQHRKWQKGKDFLKRNSREGKYCFITNEWLRSSTGGMLWITSHTCKRWICETSPDYQGQQRTWNSKGTYKRVRALS